MSGGAEDPEAVTGEGSLWEEQPGHIASSLELALREGERAAQDPQNALLGPGEARRTGERSPWQGRYCLVCQHTFRTGDRVKLCPECQQAYHADPSAGLPCWTDQFQEPGAECRGEGCHYRPPEEELRQEIAEAEELLAKRAQQSGGKVTEVAKEFMQALDEAEQGAELAERLSQREATSGQSPWWRTTCHVCGHTFRTDDIVAGCPCVPPCSAKFHEDVFANMNCWSALLAGGYDKCPGCGRPIPGIAARAAQPSSDSSN